VIINEMVHNPALSYDGRPQPRFANVGRLTRPVGRRHARRRDGQLSPRNDLQGSTADTRVVERFTRVDDDTISYELPFSDPNAYIRPWST